MVLVLVGGGHSAGKRTVCTAIEKHVTLPNTDVYTIAMDSTPGRSSEVFTAVAETITHLEAEATGNLVVLVHGLYALYDEELRDRAQMKVFVDCDADTRLNRWITRDVLQDGKDLSNLLEFYLKSARPEYMQFIRQTKDYADVVLMSEDAKQGIELVCDGITPMITHTRGVLDAEGTPYYDVS